MSTAFAAEPSEVAPAEGTTATSEFAADLAQRIEPVQAGLRRLLAEWGSPFTAADLDRLSGAGSTLCWQVFRIVKAEDPIAEARNVPSPTYLRKLLAAADAAGVSSGTLRAVEAAVREFKEFSKRAASDRAAFDSMVAGLNPEQSSEKIHMSQRRAAYRAMSHIEGIQTDLLYFGSMVRRTAPGADTADHVVFSAQRGIRRLRPEAQVTLFAYNQNIADATGIGGVAQPENAIDTEAARRYGMPVLPQFSTSPLPQIERTVLSSGYVLYTAVGTEIGTRGDFQCTLGRLERNAQIMPDGDNGRVSHSTFNHLRKPVALAYQDLLVHRPSFPDAKPELMVYKHMEGVRAQESVQRLQQYPVEERVQALGRADRVGLIELPYFPDMLRYGATAAGWDLSEFDVFRVRMPYPIMLSSTRLFFRVD